MSYEYDRYLAQHKSNVEAGFRWLQKNLPEITEGGGAEHNIVFAHDQSKTEPDEYGPYDIYFYGGNRSYAVVEDFRKAWLLHIHRNPHHWQYWVLINDDPEEGEIILEMPYCYILEMICDWWSFSWFKGNLLEIFSWYEEHKNYIKLHPNTRKLVEDILVVKVNMFCRSRELNDIRRCILSQIENGKVVVLPAYCDAQIVPDDIEIIRVEDLSGDKNKGENHENPTKSI